MSVAETEKLNRIETELLGVTKYTFLIVSNGFVYRKAKEHGLTIWRHIAWGLCYDSQSMARMLIVSEEKGHTWSLS